MWILDWSNGKTVAGTCPAPCSTRQAEQTSVLYRCEQSILICSFLSSQTYQTSHPLKSTSQVDEGTAGPQVMRVSDRVSELETTKACLDLKAAQIVHRT